MLKKHRFQISILIIISAVPDENNHHEPGVHHPGQSTDEADIQADDGRSADLTSNRRSLYKTETGYRGRAAVEHHAASKAGAEMAIVQEKDTSVLLEQGLLADWGGASVGVVIGVAVVLAIVVITVSAVVVRTQRAASASAGPDGVGGGIGGSLGGTITGGKKAFMAVVKRGNTGGGVGSGGGGAGRPPQTPLASKVNITGGRDVDTLKLEIDGRESTPVGPIPGGPDEKYRSLKRGSAASMATVASGGVVGGGFPSPKPGARSAAAAATASPQPAARRDQRRQQPATLELGSAAPKLAWNEMLKKADDEVEVVVDVGGGLRPVSVSELPPPPLEMLTGGSPSASAAGDGCGRQGAEDDDPAVDEGFGRELEDDPELAGGVERVGGVGGTEDGLSVDSEELCCRQQPPFEGRSFIYSP